MFDLPEVRGTLTLDKPLDGLTWMRVGGPADVLFQPADEDDLAAFLADLDPRVPVFAMGVGSNLIVRDGGIRGVVIRMGRGFNGIEIGDKVVAGAAALDAHVARKAATAGLDLSDGRRDTLPARALDLQYRQSTLPEGAIIVRATLQAPQGAAAALEQRMADQLAKRDETQPTKDRTAGSTFRNPAGFRLMTAMS